MGGSLSPEMLILEMTTDYHLSQLDWTTQIFLELLVLRFVLNTGQLGSPEILMTIDSLCSRISVVDNQHFTRSLDS
jgi:hypothetical protein